MATQELTASPNAHTYSHQEDKTPRQDNWTHDQHRSTSHSKVVDSILA